jgi:predicted transcriptional regulator of viral defense system
MRGIGKQSRERLAQVLRGTSGTITAGDGARLLAISTIQAAKLLAFWANQGWLKRVRRGLYIPVPLDSLTQDIAPEDPWVLANRIWAPCYIGGWSAAEHWDFTEQIFSSVMVFTVKQLREREIDLDGMKFFLKRNNEKVFFGLQVIWKGRNKISISDPSRTIVDLLDDPSLGGGMRPTKDILSEYLRSKYRDLKKLGEYALQLNNRTAFKRLGFLIEELAPNESKILEFCRNEMSKGNSQLDPELPSRNLITRWRLWVPESWRT